MYFAEQNFAEIEADNRSFVIAYANLLQRFGMEHDPVVLSKILVQDHPVIDWWSVSEYIEGVEIKDMSEDGAWPNSNDAIVKFRRMDVAAAGPVDHYCLIADIHVGSIIDSLDGVIKNSREYGEPLGFACYVRKLDGDEPVSDILDDESADTAHFLLPGESIWDFARRVHISAKDLIEQNGIADPYNIAPDFEIYMPLPTKMEDPYRIDYEVLETPVIMHVSKSDGTRKQTFGGVKKLEHIQPTGPRYAENTNITVYAIARVPVEGEIASYYMDARSLGNYVSTGRVAYTTGFNHTHLSAGAVEFIKHVPQAIEAPPIEPEVPVQAEMPAEIPVVAMEVVPAPPIEKHINYDAFKSSYHPFSRGSIKYIFTQNTIIDDLDGRRRPSEYAYRYDEIDIAGTLQYQGAWYGRPVTSVEDQNYLCAPMAMLTPYAEVYNPSIALGEKVALKQSHNKTISTQKLSFAEKRFVTFSKTAAQYNKLKIFINEKTDKPNGDNLS